MILTGLKCKQGLKRVEKIGQIYMYLLSLLQFNL